MLGPYGGSVMRQDGRTRESVASDVALLLARGGAEEPREALTTSQFAEEAALAVPPAPLESTPRGPLAIAVHSNGHELEYDADLGHCERLTLGGSAAEWLQMLSSVAEFVAILHTSGRAHGDLRVGMLLRREHETLVIVPPAGLDAPALLAARLRAGAHPTEVAYAAPEVAHGSPATPASDVYSLAALAFAAIGGRAPLALVDARSVFTHFGDDVAEALIAALDPLPEERPSAAALARTLRAWVALLRASGAETVAARPESASILAAVLMVGAVAVFTGILGLAVTRWGQVGANTRLLLFNAFTLAIFGAGAALLRFGNRRTGVGLCVLAGQLLWADAWLLLAIAGFEQSYAAWAIVGALIGAFQCGVAARMGWVLMGGFGALAFTVSAVTLGLLLPIGRGQGPPVFAALIALALFSAELYLSRWRAATLPLSIASGFWIAASAALSLVPLAAGELTALAWPYLLAAASAGLAIRLRDRASVLRFFAISLLLAAPTAQALVLVDRGYTVHIAALASLGIAAVSARISSGGWPMALSLPAAAWTTASAITGMNASNAWPWIWVYVLLALVGLAAHFAKRAQARLAAGVLGFTALGMLVLAPSVQALVFRDQIAVVAVVSLLGLAVVGYALRLGLPAQGERAATLVGLTAAIASPAVLTLFACMGHAASELDQRARFGGGDRWVYLGSCALVSVLLLAVAIASKPRGRAHRQAVEIGAVGVGAGIPFVLSLAVARDDLFYSSMALLLGGAALAVALVYRRLLLAMASAGLMLLVLSVQYFAKLGATLHWGLLAVGFGLVVLCAATLYERKLKQLLPGWQRWD
jgi:hypothetical protein